MGNYCRLLPPAVVIALAIGCAAQTSQQNLEQGKACGLTAPPKESAVSTNHGFYYFVFPRTLPMSYTGCQIMWGEDGRRVFLLRFTNGEMERFESYPLDVNETLRTCKYGGGKLTSEASTDCPPYEAFKNGIRTFSSTSEPRVPAQRDPRLK